MSEKKDFKSGFVAIIGRPNVGKSTFVNALLGQERFVVSDVPGTTRVLAWINVVDAGKALVYVPGQDPMPSGNGWPTNLAAATKQANTSGGGSIEFDLKGERFGQKGLRYGNHDEALWDRLEALGHQLETAHEVVSTIGNPDFVTGGSGAP